MLVPARDTGTSPLAHFGCAHELYRELREGVSSASYTMSEDSVLDSEGAAMGLVIFEFRHAAESSPGAHSVYFPETGAIHSTPAPVLPATWRVVFIPLWVE